MQILTDIREVFSELVPLQKSTKTSILKHRYRTCEDSIKIPQVAVTTGLSVAATLPTTISPQESYEGYSLDRLGLPVIIFDDKQPCDNGDDEEEEEKPGFLDFI